MGASMSISILLGITWIAVLGLGGAGLALALQLGQDYVFTAPGVSRQGPRTGRRLPRTAFIYRGTRVRLRDVLASDRPTLLLFLGPFGRDTRTKQKLLPDLLQFVQSAEDSIKVLVFCTDACDHVGQQLNEERSIDVIPLPDDRLMTRLEIRAMPYALLADRRAMVLEKGLINHLEHLCLLIVRGGHRWSARLDGVAHLNQVCTVHLENLDVA